MEEASSARAKRSDWVKEFVMLKQNGFERKEIILLIGEIPMVPNGMN